jgi:hypothetical protein
LHEPDNQTLAAKSEAGLMNYETAVRKAVDTRREWFSVVWHPANSTEEDMQYSYSTPTSSTDGSLGILITGAAGLSYEWEVYSIQEFIGPNVTSKRLTHIDPVGVSVAQLAVEKARDIWNSDTASRIKNVLGIATQELGGMSGVVGALGGSVMKAALPSVANAVLTNYFSPNGLPRLGY